MATNDTTAKIEAYLEKQQQWHSQLLKLREILGKSELEETVKWGVPTYTLEGKIIASIAGFKNHCAIWFHNGAFLKDDQNVLVNAQEGTTRGLRHWRFKQGEKVPITKVRAYVKEAIANEQAGKKIKPEKKKLILPEELEVAIEADIKLKTAFNKLPPGKQREFCEHIGRAKQEKTRYSRLEKVMPQILAGKGLYDKYKNC